MKNKVLVIMLFAILLILPSAMASTSYTSTTRTTCDGTSCVAEVHTGTYYVSEGGTWKTYTEASSLKDKGFGIIYLETDSDYDVSVVNFNTTSITVDLTSDIFGSNIPVRIWTPSDIGLETTPDKRFEESHNISYTENLTFVTATPQRKTYSFGLGKILEFGINSTVITISPSEATYFIQENPNTNYNSDTALQLLGATSYLRYSFLKFTLTSIEGPIHSASLNLMPTDAPTTAISGYSHHLYNQTWSGSQIVYSNWTSFGPYNLTYTQNVTGFPAGTWATWNVTDIAWISRDRNDEANMSILLTATGGSAGNYQKFAKGAVLNITYTSVNPYFQLNNETFDIITYETDYNTLTFNATGVNGWNITTAKLVYNGTSYTSTLLWNSNTSFQYGKTFINPLVTIQNVVPFVWNITLTHVNSTIIYKNYTDVHNQFITNISFGQCSIALPTKYLNITFKDETTAEYINATLSGTFDYYLGDGSVYNTLSYYNISNNYQYPFCFTPNTRTVLVNGTDLTYQQYPYYPQRNSDTNWVLTSSVTNTTYNLLSTSYGLYVTFQVINQLYSPIQNVLVNAEKNVIGVYSLVDSGYTDSAGGVTFWLDPNYQHRFNFTKTGYQDYSTTLTPTQSSYTITLGTSANESINYYSGIIIKIGPTNTVLTNNTIYTFYFNITSSVNTLSSYGFTLAFSNGTSLTTVTGTTGTGSNLTLNVNVSNSTNMTMTYYWVINSSTSTGYWRWRVGNVYQGEFSLMHFFDDLKAFGKSGFNDFTLAILGLFFILIITGLVSYFGNLSSPFAIALTACIATAIFDYGAGFFPQINGFPIVTAAALGLLIAIGISELRG